MIRGSSLALVLLLLTASAASAQLPDSLSDRGRIYVLTTMPGSEVHTRYGHTAIRVHDRYLGMDVTFNYGTFDFQAPGFLSKFVHGETDYFLSFGSTRRAVQSARIQGRTVRQQLLDLNREHRDAIYAALLENALPENRTYRYDFLFDNCGTRPRDVIETIVGESLDWDTTGFATPTFRELLDPYHADAPAIDLGTDLVLGSRLDRPATAREQAFLPLGLEDLLATAWVEDQYGRRPLVLVQDTLSWAERPEMPAGSFPWPTALASLLALIGVAPLARQQGRAFGKVDQLILGLFGLIGVVLLYMSEMTAHHVTGANLNLLWAFPLHLVAAFALHRVRPKLASGYLLLSAIMAALSLTGGALLPQPLPMAMVPLVLMAAIRFATVGWRLRA